MKKITLLLLLYFCYLTALHAQTNLQPLNLSVSHPTVGQAMLMYEDRNGSMTFDDVRKLPLTDFTPLNKPVSSHIFTTAALWYQFRVKNETQEGLSKLLVFQPAWLDSVNLSVISADGSETSYKGGNLYPYAMRAIDHFLINFKHTFNTGVSTVYVRVKTRDPFIVSLSVMDETVYLLNQSTKSFLVGFIYGGIIAMLFYNLFLFFAMRKRDYAYYVLALLTFLMMNASYNGYTFMYIFSDYPNLQNWSQSTSIYLFIIALLLFAREFLNLKNNYPMLSRASLYLIYTILVFSLLTLIVGGYHYHVLFAIIFIVIGTSFILGTAIYSWFKGNQSARFFIFGSASGLTGVLITALTVMSFIPYSYLTYKASDFGIYLDVIFLALALADRMKLIHEQKVIAEKEAKTDGLTGLLNLRSYYEISNSEYKRLIRHKKAFSVIMLDIDNFKDVNDNYGHSIGDAALKSVSKILTENIREYDYAFRRGGDEFLIFLPETEKSRAYQLAQRIRTHIQNTKIALEMGEIQITCSFGISEFEENDTNLEAVVKRADKALYQVKNAAKNNVKVWSL